jgi:hypothetical protein
MEQKVGAIIERYGGGKECKIWVTAVQPDESWDNPGYWDMYNPTINLKIVLTSESDEKSIIMNKLQSGDFIVNIQNEVYYATLDWYRENYSVDLDDLDEDEETWGDDGINDDALYEITCSGGSGFKVE